MNVVFIVLDSFRQDHVSLYHRGVSASPGIDPCRTPNIDAFAGEAVVFDNAYPEALPTIPIRCQLMTGQRTLHSRGWQPLTAEDVHIAQILSEEGYVCGLVTDTYHYRAPGMNYHRNFASYDWIRGQEYDPCISAPTRRNLDDYVNENFPETWRRRLQARGSRADSPWFEAFAGSVTSLPVWEGAVRLATDGPPAEVAQAALDALGLRP